MNFSKYFGSILIIIGTAIGAGMLALPLVSAGAGFVMAALLLIAVWAISTFTALLVLETNLAFKPLANNFTSMASATLGKFGNGIVWITCLLLLYSITAAYIAGNTSLLSALLTSVFHINVPSWINAIVFTAVLGGIIFWNTALVDYINRSLWSVKGLALIATLVLLAPHINFMNLFNPAIHKHKFIFAAIPIFVCAFCFHNTIPSLANYIGQKPKELKKIIIIGSTITVTIYFFWLFITLGVAPLAGNNSIATTHGAVDKFIAILIAAANNSEAKIALNCFANVAMTTSFLGVGLSLFDFLADGLKRKNSRSGRLQTALLTFSLPLIFALFYPEGFVLALGYAAIFISILYFIIPALMTYKLRRSATLKSPYRVSGGTSALILVIVAAVVVIILQILFSLSLLPVL